MAYSISKKGNDYALALSNIDAPKPVWMAIAYALTHRTLGTDPTPAEVTACIRKEWTLLHQNGIVPQRPRWRL